MKRRTLGLTRHPDSTRKKRTREEDLEVVRRCIMLWYCLDDDEFPDFCAEGNPWAEQEADELLAEAERYSDVKLRKVAEKFDAVISAFTKTLNDLVFDHGGR